MDDFVILKEKKGHFFSFQEENFSPTAPRFNSEKEVTTTTSL